MENTGLWVTIIIIVFVLGSILNLRASPREKALAELREKARKMGLHPRLIPAPAWLKLPKNGQYAPMIAYYHLIVADARFPFMQIRYDEQQQSHIVVGTLSEMFSPPPIPIYGIEQQANSIGVYWDESNDLHAEQLINLKQWLENLAQIHH